jgi:hypothetical protein
VSIASRVVPGDVRDDRAFFAEQRVEQRAFADVRAADDRDRQFVSSGVSRFPGGKRSTIASSRSPVPSPWIAETTIGSPKPRRANSPGIEALHAFGFGLVRDQITGCRVLRMMCHDVVVERREPGLRVDDEDDDVGFACGDFGLRARPAR